MIIEFSIAKVQTGLLLGLKPVPSTIKGILDMFCQASYITGVLKVQTAVQTSDSPKGSQWTAKDRLVSANKVEKQGLYSVDPRSLAG